MDGENGFKVYLAFSTGFFISLLNSYAMGEVSWNMAGLKKLRLKSATIVLHLRV